ncbi:MAG: hypothetical protein HUU19_01665 [Phycisphaerales bacterium]|nr:hypothetical protein [Phycisphaerales bacterium]
MIEPQSLEELRRQMQQRMAEDRALLDDLRAEIRALNADTRRIQPRSTTAVSLVGSDGGNNKVQFDPFLVQLVRVVDSNNHEYCLEAVTPTSDISALNDKHVDASGKGKTALGRMMEAIGVRTLWDLSHMIPRPPDPTKPREPISPSWVQVYREIMEWAFLLTFVRETPFGSDTVIVRDGFLRSKVFRGGNFPKIVAKLKEGVDEQFRTRRRRVLVAGVAKHSKVLQRYQLAMALEGVMRHPYPCYVQVPREIEMKAYVWSEYARGDAEAGQGGEANKFVAGHMFFVKFGSRPHDPVWPIDVFDPQVGDAGTILSYLLADANEGFPVPFYPMCLQKAHEHAALVDFDMVILQDAIYSAIRDTLGEHRAVLDEFSLADEDPAARRYQ